jgi:fumarate reductase subunit C
MNGRLELWLFVAQRLSAAVLAPLVLIHLATMIYAVQGDLTAAQILSRTQSGPWWTAFYGLFVAAAALHGAIGLRTIIREMTPLKGAGASVAAGTFGLAVLALGIRAVAALT